MEDPDWELFTDGSSFVEAWDGPHQVILTTFTAVKVAGIDSWIHYTRVKKVPAQWETQVLSPTRMIIRPVYFTKISECYSF
uniref:Murine leukemia virus integrase C-terminal domain-containing protein n=1 Tax=Serinus canaria TaxID=9135 RepID=A0A8C9UCB2_SERCA